MSGEVRYYRYQILYTLQETCRLFHVRHCIPCRRRIDIKLPTYCMPSHRILYTLQEKLSCFPHQILCMLYAICGFCSHQIMFRRGMYVFHIRYCICCRRHADVLQENLIHLLPSLEGDTKICPTLKIHVTRGRSPRETWIFWVGQIFVSPD